MAFRPIFFVVVACTLPLLVASPVLAQTVDDATRGTARKIGYAGVDAYQAGDYATARDKLDKSYRVLKAPSLGLWLARSLVKLGKLVEASERYLEVTQLPVSGGDIEVQKQAQADASAELRQLTPRIPSVVIRIEGADSAGVKVTIDDAPMAPELLGEARPINPGRHEVRGSSGGAPIRIEVTVGEGEQKTAVVRFGVSGGAGSERGPDPVLAPAGTTSGDASHSRAVIAWTALGVGGAGLAVGAIAGGMALGKKSTIDNDTANCRDNKCLGGAADTVDSYNTLRGVSSVGFIAGGVLAATGVVLLLTQPKSSPTAAVRSQGRGTPFDGPRAGTTSLWLSPASVGVRGTF